MKTLEPIFEGRKHYYLCPRFGVAMQEGKNIPTNRKCPNSHRNAGKMGCSEICYYNPVTKKPPTPIGNFLRPHETEGTHSERYAVKKVERDRLKKLRESRNVGVKFPYKCHNCGNLTRKVMKGEYRGAYHCNECGIKQEWLDVPAFQIPALPKRKR